MAITARLDLAFWRNDDTFAFPLRVRGPDLTGVALKAQIRRTPDAPGAALATLAVTTNTAVDGIRRIGAATLVDGVYVNDFVLQLTKTTRQGLPYDAELGAAMVLAWALQIAGVTRLVGNVVIEPHAIDSDAAPSARAPASGTTPDGYPVAGATLTIAADAGAIITLDGADMLGGLVQLAQQAATGAAASQVAIAGTAALVEEVAQRPGIKYAFTAFVEGVVDQNLFRLDARYRQVFKTVDGPVTVENFLARIPPPFTAFVDGAKSKATYKLDARGRLIDKTDAGAAGSGASALVETYVTTAGTGADLGFGSFNADPNVIYLFLVWGQSLAPGTDRRVGATKLTTTTRYPGKTLMCDSGVQPMSSGTPQAINALVDLVERDVPTYYHETICSGFAETFCKSIFDAVGVMPTVAMAITADGGQPIENLMRGGTSNDNPRHVYTELLRVDSEVRRVAGSGTRVITNLICLQGDANVIDQPTSERAYRRKMAKLQADAQADIGKRQSEPVRCFWPITNRVKSTAAGVHPEVSIAQSTAWEGNSSVNSLGPYYWLGTSDSFHLLDVSYRLFGEQLGPMVARQLFGGEAPPLAAYQVRCSNAARTQVDVICEAIKGIAIDKTGPVSPTGLGNGLGVDFVGPSGAIVPSAEPTIVGTNVIRYTFASAVEAGTFAFGACRMTGTNDNGPINGARTCFRDAASSPQLALYDGSAIRDWLTPFVLPVL